MPNPSLYESLTECCVYVRAGRDMTLLNVTCDITARIYGAFAEVGDAMKSLTADVRVCSGFDEQDIM